MRRKLAENRQSHYRYFGKFLTGTPIRAKGARLLFLPPYSPDLNPIKHVLAKLKHLLRKEAERSVEASWRRVGILMMPSRHMGAQTISETQGMVQLNVIKL